MFFVFLRKKQRKPNIFTGLKNVKQTGHKRVFSVFLKIILDYSQRTVFKIKNQTYDLFIGFEKYFLF